MKLPKRWVALSSPILRLLVWRQEFGIRSEILIRNIQFCISFEPKSSPTAGELPSQNFGGNRSGQGLRLPAGLDVH